MAAKRGKARRVAERPAGRTYRSGGRRSAYFADTAYFLAFVNPSDTYHDRARSWNVELARSAAPVVTTHAVLLEVGSALARRTSRRQALAIVEGVSRDATVSVLPISTGLFGRGVSLFRDRADHDWSLTDCISFVVMSDFGMTDALTSDRHFEQAGFRALLRGS